MNNRFCNHWSGNGGGSAIREPIEVLMAANHLLAQYEGAVRANPLSTSGVYADAYGMQRFWVQERFAGSHAPAVSRGIHRCLPGVGAAGETLVWLLLLQSALVEARLDTTLPSAAQLPGSGSLTECSSLTRRAMVTTQDRLKPPIYWQLVRNSVPPQFKIAAGSPSTCN